MNPITSFLKLQPIGGDRLRSVGRMILLAGLVGVVAGLGAVVFQILSHTVLHYGLAWFAGYKPGMPAGEHDLFGETRPLLGGFAPLLLLAVITVGGLVAGLIVFRFAPEAEGHGTDAAIRAFHRDEGRIRSRVPLVKLLASAVTLGTGGSGGREGPIAQIGAGFGSFLATRLGLSAYERRLLLAAGMGAGVAAIFRAPLAGAIFATEVLYRDEDFEAEALIPAFIASTSAYCIYGLLIQGVLGMGPGFRHIFSIAPGLSFNDPKLLLPLGGLAMIVTLAAILYVQTFYGLRDLFKRLRIPVTLKPAVGAFTAGLVALGLYWGCSQLGPAAQAQSLGVLSTGYGVIQDCLAGRLPQGAAAAITLLVLVALGKILTTSLSIGSGGSAGVFGPSMVIGGALGGAVGLLFHAWVPALVTRIDVFVILGMAGFFSAAAKTPVSTIIIVSELTGGYEMLLPAMWVSSICYLLSARRWTIYREQVPSRAESPAHREDFITDVLKGLTVSSARLGLRTGCASFPVNAPLDDILNVLPDTTQAAFPVKDLEGRYCGLFDMSDVRSLLYKQQAGHAIIAQDIMTEGVEPLFPDTDLSVIMARFAKLKYEELPVVERETLRILGMLSRREIISVYELRLDGPKRKATRKD